MKKLALILAALFVAHGAFAKKSDYRSYFAYPDVSVKVIFYGKDGNVALTTKAIPYKNHSIPKAESEQAGFSGGWGIDDKSKRSDNPSVNWRFIKKTQYGDIYVFEIRKHNKVVKTIPALYAGKSTIVYDHDKILVKIVPISR